MLSDLNRVRWGRHGIHSHQCIRFTMQGHASGIMLHTHTEKKDRGGSPGQEEKMKVITTRIPCLISRDVESVLY